MPPIVKRQQGHSRYLVADALLYLIGHDEGRRRYPHMRYAADVKSVCLVRMAPSQQGIECLRRHIAMVAASILNSGLWRNRPTWPNQRALWTGFDNLKACPGAGRGQAAVGARRLCQRLWAKLWTWLNPDWRRSGGSWSSASLYDTISNCRSALHVEQVNYSAPTIC